MGISFGQIPAGSGALRGLIEARATRSAGRQVESGVAPADGQPASSANPFRAATSPAVQAGIRGGTIGATPAAALIALGRTVQNVRENTPTIEQIQAGFRQRAEEARVRVQGELRREAFGLTQDNAPARAERPGAATPADVRGFFESVNRADQALQGQAVGATESPRANGVNPVAQDSGTNPEAFNAGTVAAARDIPAPQLERLDVSV
jgi:hypothetical protein